MERQSSAKGFTVLSVAIVINKLLGILYVPIATLILGNYGNGIFNAGYTIYQLVFVVTNAGIPIALSKLISEQLALNRHDVSYRTLKISALMLVIAGTFTSVLTALLAKPLSGLIRTPEAYLTILAISPTMLFTAVSCIFRGYFQGRSNMVPTSISQILEQAVHSVLTIVFAWVMYQYGVKYAIASGITGDEAIYREAARFAAAGATVGTSLGALASALYLYATFQRKKAGILGELQNTQESMSGYTNRLIMEKLLKYAVPISLGSVAIYTTQLIDVGITKARLIAGGFSEHEATSLYGILSTQYLKVLFIPVALATALGTAIIPSISAANEVNDRNLLGRRIYKSFKTILMIAVPAAIGLTVMAGPVIRILFPKSPDGWDLLMMGSWTLVLISVVSIQTSILQGIGKTYIPTIHMVIGLALKLTVNYNLIAIKSVNIKGAIVGNAVCYIFAGIMNYRAIKRVTGVKLNIKQLFNRPLSVSIIMGIIVFLVYHGLTLMTGWLVKSAFLVELICGSAAIAAGCFIYYLLMIVAKGITAEDIKSLPKGGVILRYTAKVPFMDRFLPVDR
ncbi:MAG: putative polysaccharide biosynthesis protein [Bacillota bacterium]